MNLSPRETRNLTYRDALEAWAPTAASAAGAALLFSDNIAAAVKKRSSLLNDFSAYAATRPRSFSLGGVTSIPVTTPFSRPALEKRYKAILKAQDALKIPSSGAESAAKLEKIHRAKLAFTDNLAKEVEDSVQRQFARVKSAGASEHALRQLKREGDEFVNFARTGFSGFFNTLNHSNDFSSLKSPGIVRIYREVPEYLQVREYKCF